VINEIEASLDRYLRKEHGMGDRRERRLSIFRKRTKRTARLKYSGIENSFLAVFNIRPKYPYKNRIIVLLYLFKSRQKIRELISSTVEFCIKLI